MPPPRQGRLALWLDGSMAAAAIAGWLNAQGAEWVALLAEEAGRPARSHQAAEDLARHWGVPTRPVRTGSPVLSPLGWAQAAESALEAGARWLVLPTLSAKGEVPVALRLHAAETALLVHGLEGLWVPLLGWDPIAVGRLALAVGAPLASSWDCRAEAACEECSGCKERDRVFKQIGLPH